ncbi:MAG: hypothetical protein M1524_00470 [Patescibacteria group bacterium]|nr:hypothetical protein [Patescibacteria group bacterium]
MKKPTTIFMGSKPGAVVALSILLDRGWDVKYVVISKTITHPWIGGKTLEQLAKEKNITVTTQEKLPKKIKVDFVISYMFRHRVSQYVICQAKRAALNFHAAPLPQFGGWAFYNLAILENAKEYGCTCHYMDNNFDTGPILKVRRFKINASSETALSLERKAQEEMILLFIDFCKIAEKNKKLPVKKQNKSKMRYMTLKELEKLKKIPKSTDLETIDRYSRAFWYPPYPGAYVKIGKNKIEIIPTVSKDEIAKLLHRDDLEYLLKFYQSQKDKS